jgi:hypothetical protein
MVTAVDTDAGGTAVAGPGADALAARLERTGP